MSKELTPEMREQIEKEAEELYPYGPNAAYAYAYTVTMERGAYKKGRSKSITEIQELREEIKLLEKQNQDYKSDADREAVSIAVAEVEMELTVKYDQKIAAMSEYIKALEEVKDNRMVNPHYGNGSVKKKLEALRDKAGL